MLNLVPFTPEHFPILASWFASQSDVVQWGGPFVTYPLDAGQMQAMLAEGRRDPPARLCWMAAEGMQLAGHAQLAFDWRNGVGLIGRVAVAPEARGRGLAVPMLRLVLGEAFARPAIERVELNVYAWNTPAIRTYERLGFVTEGTRRSSVQVGGERWDTVMMGLLRPEWARISEPAP